MFLSIEDEPALQLVALLGCEAAYPGLSLSELQKVSVTTSITFKQ